MFGLEVTSTFVSERENVDEDICAMGSGPFKVEVDLMQPLDPEKKPAVHATPLNHVGLWIDDLPKAVEWLSANGVRFAPGGIRKGAAGFDITFLHPKANEEFPIGGEGVLIELVQAPKEVVDAFAKLAGNEENMADIPEDDLAESRAALAPTLDATAAILPWVAKPRPARFDPKLNERWIAAGKCLYQAWSDRHGASARLSGRRSSSFTPLRSIPPTAIACASVKPCASAADRLEDEVPSPRLIAALTASIECLHDPAGLEHDAFDERARHFAARLEATATTAGAERSAVLDQLFVDEAREQIELLRDALATLPPDAYVLLTEALKLAQHAEMLEIWGIMHLARQFAACVNQHASELDGVTARAALDDLLQKLSAGIDAVAV